MNRVAPLLVAAVAVAYFAAFVHYGILLEDEGLILMQIARTADGARPYLDFHTGYAPGGFYLNALLFHAFGRSVIPLRVALVAVNAASTTMLFVLARRVAGPALAAAVALGWMTHLPVFVGLFASFNVPYPSWYGVCAYLATQLAFDRHLATGRRAPLLAAGLAAGIGFSIKQNVGSLAALSCGLVLALLHAGDDDSDRRPARVLLVLAAAFLLVGFTVAVTTVEAAFILGPTLVLIAGRLGWARATLRSSIRLVPGVALVAAGFVAVSALWLLPFVAVLGMPGLAREVFLVGTDFDLVYATPYPIPLAVAEAWPVIGTLALMVLALGGLGAARGRIGAGAATATALATAAGCCALVGRWSRMPEGVARSITLQAQHFGFFATPALGLAAATGWLRRVRRDPARVPDARLLAMLVFALTGFAGLYPRIDETHLLVVLPSSLVLAAWAARRLAAAWSTVLGIPAPRLRGAMAACGIGLALVAAVPSFRAQVGFHDGWPAAHDEVAVDSPAAPVHLDGPHAADTRALNALLAWLRARLAPGEPLFHFPSLALVPFLLDHPSLSRHDYWYAGRPDHLEEAEVVRQVATAAPRFVLTVNRDLGFFSNSARYYFLLRQLLRDRYTLAARFGRYDVLVRRDLATAPPVVEDFVDPVGDDLVARLAEPLYGSRLAATRAFFARVRSSADVEPLAGRVAPDDRSRLLLLRGMAEAPDLRAVPFVASTFETGPWRVRGEAAVTLNYLALYTAEHRFVLGHLAGERDPALGDLAGLVAPATARRWLADRDNRQAGAFAAWLLAATRDEESTPVLRDVVETSEKNPYLRLVAVYGLVRGDGPAHLCALVDLLGDKRHEYQDAVPSLLLDEAGEHPEALAACLRRSLADDRARAREMSAWVAGAAGLRDVVPALREALGDRDRRVRIAAAWALGRLADGDAAPALRRMAADDDDQVRAFAIEALSHVEPGAS